MDASFIFMWTGFALAAFSVVGNDVIQTLGTFLTSNEKKVEWWVLWLYAAGILTAVLIAGYLEQDVAFGRLAKFEFPIEYEWYHLLPPLTLLVITRVGIPVSTTFMVLTLFSLSDVPNDIGHILADAVNFDSKLGGMIRKSLFGYLVAFASALAIYLVISTLTEKYFIEHPLRKQHRLWWTLAQWASTGFLWSQWLMQDLANLYVYLNGGRHLSLAAFIASLLVLTGLLGLIFYLRGGKIQDVVRAKTNTTDIRSATFIDLIYGVILYIFKYDYFHIWGGKIPMSTTWVFIGLLAGRELAIRLRLEKKVSRHIQHMLLMDLGKISFGLVVSLFLVIVIKYLSA